MISGTKSNWQLIRSGIPQRSRPVPILFNFLIAWTNWEEHLIWVAIQRNLNRLQTWAKRNLTKFNKGKTKVLHLWQNNLIKQHRLGANCLENSFAEKDVSIPVENKMFLQWRSTAYWDVYEKVKRACWEKWLLPSVQNLWDHIWNTMVNFGLSSTWKVLT